MYLSFVLLDEPFTDEDLLRQDPPRTPPPPPPPPLIKENKCGRIEGERGGGGTPRRKDHWTQQLGWSPLPLTNAVDPPCYVRKKTHTPINSTTGLLRGSLLGLTIVGGGHMTAGPMKNQDVRWQSLE